MGAVDRPEDWKSSAVYLAGLVKSIRAAGLLEAVLERVPPETRAVVDNPYGQRWHPWTHGAALATAVLELAGPRALEDITFVMARDSFGPILTPMLQVALTLMGMSPASVFSRVDQSIKPAIQGVTARFDATGPTSGAVSFEYPTVPAPFADTSWRGGLRFMFHLVGLEGRIGPCERLEGGRVLRYAVSWG
ncbi:MAG: hypothetical protein MUC96_13005 [Myxococcaceae bacterium]|jgi:hypothetical protein|nr:hypothetical protein [Myxococcaceae bacterium]